MKIILKATVFSLLLLLGVVFALPTKAHAIDFNPFNPLDPFCLFSDCDDSHESQQVYNTNTYDSSINSSFNGNTNSFNGGNVSLQGTAGVGYQAPAYQVPVYQAPAYNYGDGGNTYVIPQLSVSCYPIPTTATVGNTVQWRSSISGGNGAYHVSWTGTDGLSGIGETVTKVYNQSGTKNATISVISGRMTSTKNCTGTITVQNNTTYDYPTPTYNYNPQPYQPSYYPLAISCRANTTSVQPGSSVYWTAYASGGLGDYSYSWSGTDNLYGSGNTASAYYSNPGTKTAWVSVRSGSQTTSAQCSNYVTVHQQYYQPQQPYYPPQQTYYPPISYGGIQVACGADTTSTKIGIPVTWSAEASVEGKAGGLSYSWTGSEGLYGSQSSAVAKYSSAGTKSASVTVVGQNGQSMTKVCTNTVYVSSGTKVVSKPTVVSSPTPTPIPTPQVAASLFSLNNVPWGWVAVLIILVLLGVVSYLIFNKKKI